MSEYPTSDQRYAAQAATPTKGMAAFAATAKVAEVGTCLHCGQELIRTADDCWHPSSVTRACPPEITTPENPVTHVAWGDGFGRPGRDAFAGADEDNEAAQPCQFCGHLTGAHDEDGECWADSCECGTGQDGDPQLSEPTDGKPVTGQAVIHKVVFDLAKTPKDPELVQTFEVPTDAKLVAVGWDTRKEFGIALWYRAALPTGADTTWRVMVRGTGHDFPAWAGFLGTATRDGFAWHLLDADGDHITWGR